MIAKHSTLTLNPSSRKSRSKRRKPKYLRLQLIATAAPPPMPTATTTPTQPHDHKQLINLFPLHPENLVEQDKLDEEHNMACIFSSCDDDRAATTLTGILCSDDEDEEVVEEENTNNTNNNNNPSPSSVNYADEEVELVRTAMRRNKTERDRHDLEKWVSYSEVVERKKVMMIRGMSSSSSSSTSCNHNNHRSKLVLKLDYGKVMDSWVNKGPLYIHQNSDPATQPQIVPDLQDDDFFFPSSTAPLNDITHDRDNGGSGGSWTVPEIIHVENTDMGGGEDALQMVGSNAMIQHREASVQRYKEKRRNRLFAKTIRYEVRKLNAQKRPRIKGRFVKRN